MKLRPKDLSKIGIKNNIVRSLIIEAVARNCKHDNITTILSQITDVINSPQKFYGHFVWGQVAQAIMPEEPEHEKPREYALKTEHGHIEIFGREIIEPDAIRQMELAMQLPIAVAGALMPDAHAGYGLPIGGVLATDNAVIPYGVGLDIGCGMRLTVLDAKPEFITRYATQIERALIEHTHFGMEGGLAIPQEHDILDRNEWHEIELLTRLHRKARQQLGSSGGGNHFVEIGELYLQEGNGTGLPQGEYVALLSHSGSRGLGAEIAKYYVQRAHEQCCLPQSASHLVWLNLDTEAGNEYWQCMNLAIDYATACHDCIHANLGKALGLKPIATIGSHHNMATQETIDGRTLVVHRKGAVNADAGTLSIIPGSMATAGYLVAGKGNLQSLNSASHGAGRAMSRADATQRFTMSAVRRQLRQRCVTLVGGSIEECSDAYKDIETVIACQSALIDIQGRFMPRIVRMNDK